MGWIEIIRDLGIIAILLLLLLPTDRFYVISAIIALILVQNMKR